MGVSWEQPGVIARFQELGSRGLRGHTGPMRLMGLMGPPGHLSPFTSHHSGHRPGLYLRFAWLQLGNPSDGCGDVGFS